MSHRRERGPSQVGGQKGATLFHPLGRWQQKCWHCQGQAWAASQDEGAEATGGLTEQSELAKEGRGCSQET